MQMIEATISALKDDMPAVAVKLGMMGTDAVVCAVGEFLDNYEGKVVCDPVMISTRYVLLLLQHRKVTRTRQNMSGCRQLRYCIVTALLRSQY